LTGRGREGAAPLSSNEKHVDAVAVLPVSSTIRPRAKGQKDTRANAHGVYAPCRAISRNSGEYERTGPDGHQRIQRQITRSICRRLEAFGRRKVIGSRAGDAGLGGCPRFMKPRSARFGMLECGPAAGRDGQQARGDFWAIRCALPPTWAERPSRSRYPKREHRIRERADRSDRFHYTQTKMRLVDRRGRRIDHLVEAGRHGSPEWDRDRRDRGRAGLLWTRWHEPTLTEVFMLIGYMDHRHFIGGHMTPTKAAA